MKKSIPEILWHHGTCDVCSKKFIMVCHFGYNQQPKKNFRVCEKCLATKANLVMKL